jgi:hypothetical protein
LIQGAGEGDGRKDLYFSNVLEYRKMTRGFKVVLKKAQKSERHNFCAPKTSEQFVMERVCSDRLGGYPPKALSLRLRLQMFQYPQSKRSNPKWIQRELERILQTQTFTPVSFRQVGLQRRDFRPVHESFAFNAHKLFHYLGNPRRAIKHFGLFGPDPDNLLGLFSFSANDLRHLNPYLPAGIQPEDVLVLSRMISSDEAPPNTLSYGLGQCFRWLRENMPHIKMLITYLDPNLELQGSVYKATNWSLLGHEAKKRYLYLDRHYVTDRTLIEIYQTADFHKLRKTLGERIRHSHGSLKPLQLWVIKLDPKKPEHKTGQEHLFIEPNPMLVGV